MNFFKPYLRTPIFQVYWLPEGNEANIINLFPLSYNSENESHTRNFLRDPKQLQCQRTMWRSIFVEADEWMKGGRVDGARKEGGEVPKWRGRGLTMISHIGKKHATLSIPPLLFLFFMREILMDLFPPVCLTAFPTATSWPVSAPHTSGGNKHAFPQCTLTTVSWT
jgi:hypothetical protein